MLARCGMPARVSDFKSLPRCYLGNPAATTPAPAPLVTRWPRIYIYQLPAHFRNCSLNPQFVNNSNYAAEQLVPAAIRSSAFVTEDPETADLFLVDVWLYCRNAQERFDAAELGR